LSGPRVELVTGADEGLIAELTRMESAVFRKEMLDDHGDEHYRYYLTEPECINVVLHGADGGLIGYLAAVPLGMACEYLLPHDPALNSARGGYYVDTIQTLPGRRAPQGLVQLLNAMFAEAARRGTNRFSMHVRRTNGFSRVVQRLYPETRLLRTIENWYGYGEPFDYLEGDFVGGRRAARKERNGSASLF